MRKCSKRAPRFVHKNPHAQPAHRHSACHLQRRGLPWRATGFFIGARLLVSDDGSSDDTLAIIDSYRARLGERLVLAPNPAPGRGVVGNFAHLMQLSVQHAWCHCAAFCDQDDVWLPHKLATGLARLQALALDATDNTPCMVHSDLTVVDARLRTIHPSFVQHQRLDLAHSTALTLLSINHATGCTMLVNRALLQAALPLPPAAIMHDWWCALVAERAAFIPEALVRYRQHGNNQLGAKGRTLRQRLHRVAVDAPGVLRRVRSLGQATGAQAEALRQRLQALGHYHGHVDNYLAWRAQPLVRRMAGWRRYYAGPLLDGASRLLFW